MTDLNEIIIIELHKNKRAKKISRDYEKSKYETNESYRELKLKKERMRKRRNSKSSPEKDYKELQNEFILARG